VPDSVHISVHGDEEAERQIRRLALFISDLRPFWPRVSRLFVGWMRLQFDSEGAFFGVGRKWTPLSPAYAERKRILWGERPILQASGQAKRAAMSPIRIPGPRSLTLVIDDAGPAHEAILQYHQDGGPNLPRRPVMGATIPPLAALELGREAEHYVRDLLRRF
jgi:hypothetical protein